eukprot:4008556-Alexandrium_andersonii.AAC.1
MAQSVSVGVEAASQPKRVGVLVLGLRALAGVGEQRLNRSWLLLLRQVVPPGQLGSRVARTTVREWSGGGPIDEDVHRHVVEDLGRLGLLLHRLHSAGAGAVRLSAPDREDVGAPVEEGLDDPGEGLVDVGLRAVGGRPQHSDEAVGPGCKGGTDAAPEVGVLLGGEGAALEELRHAVVDELGVGDDAGGGPHQPAHHHPDGLQLRALRRLPGALAGQGHVLGVALAPVDAEARPAKEREGGMGAGAVCANEDVAVPPVLELGIARDERDLVREGAVDLAVGIGLVNPLALEEEDRAVP